MGQKFTVNDRAKMKIRLLGSSFKPLKSQQGEEVDSTFVSHLYRHMQGVKESKGECCIDSREETGDGRVERIQNAGGKSLY